jgi:hypothetical protein
MTELTKSIAERWTKQLGWLDDWFRSEKAGAHDLDPDERELFDVLSPAWLTAEPGAGKIAALDSAAERYGKDRVLALLDKLCADETRAWWKGEVAREGGSLDDLLRLLWAPLPGLGFELAIERGPASAQLCCRRCPQHELALELGAADWLYALVCATDPYATEAFDSIRFRRTRTLMQGDDSCDHAYFLEP